LNPFSISAGSDYLCTKLTEDPKFRTPSHILVDTLGLVLAVLVTGANVQDRDAAKELLASFYGAFFQSFRLKRVWADASYQGALIPWIQAAFAWALDIVRRKEQQTGFEVLPKCWGSAPAISSKRDPIYARVEGTWRKTMGKQRKTWTAEVKEAIVLTVLRSEISVAEAARQHGVNESLIHTWKAHFLEGGRARLAGEGQDNGQAALERENDRLKRIVAEKELELDISRKVRRL
jgi:transposase